MDSEDGEWHVTTDPARVRQWADRHDAVPIRDPNAAGTTGLAVTVEPQTSTVGQEGGVERLPWDQFLELFEAESLAFRYREGDPERVEPTCQLIDRSEDAEPSTDAATGTTAQDVASDHFAVSDTGDAEPVVDEPIESREADAERSAERSHDRDEDANDRPATDASEDDLASATPRDVTSRPPEERGRAEATDEDGERGGEHREGEKRTELSSVDGERSVAGAGDKATTPAADARDTGEDERVSLSPKRTGGDTAPESASAEGARGAEEPPLVLDEIYEDPGSLGDDPAGEYLTLRNAGGERLDLGRWRIENERGQTFEFPDEFVLDPGEVVTIHGGAGPDDGDDLYWNADESVLDTSGGTVLVRSPDDRRVLREPYKDG